MLFTFLLAACGAPDLQPGFELPLTETGGCGDVVVFARDPDRHVGLMVRTDDALVSSIPESMTYDLTSAESATARWLTAYQGVEVGEIWCNDVSTGAEQLERSWSAVAGAMTVDVTPDGSGGGLADVAITGATLQADDDAEATVELASFAWTGIAVGWLPG